MIDLGHIDARKSAPSSQQQQEKAHRAHQARTATLRAELDSDPQALTRRA